MGESEMKILIAVPCMDQVPFTFAQSLSTLEKIGECKLAMKSGSLIYTSRNSLAMMAIQMDADFVFWLAPRRSLLWKKPF